MQGAAFAKTAWFSRTGRGPTAWLSSRKRCGFHALGVGWRRGRVRENGVVFTNWAGAVSWPGKGIRRRDPAESGASGAWPHSSLSQTGQGDRLRQPPHQEHNGHPITCSSPPETALPSCPLQPSTIYHQPSTIHLAILPPSTFPPRPSTLHLTSIRQTPGRHRA